MAKGINKVIIIGNLGQDPKTRYTAAGAAITNISVATSETWKDKQTGQENSKVEWHRIILFNRLAEVAGEYLKKGSKVYVDGRLQTRKWTDQAGIERYSTEIIAGELQMLDTRNDSAAPNQGGYANQQYGEQHSKSAQAQQQAPQQHKAPEPDCDNFEDDIPF